MPEGGEEMSEDLREQTCASAVGVVATIPCVYCQEPIAADTFVYWSSARRLLSADCPACARQVTLPAATWRRLSGSAVDATAIFAERHP